MVTPLRSPSSTLHLSLLATTQWWTHSHVVFLTPLCASWRPGSCLVMPLPQTHFRHHLTLAGYLPVQASVGSSELFQKKTLQGRLWISILFLKKDFILSYVTCIWEWGYVHTGMQEPTRVQKRAPDPLELELQAAVSCMTMC